MVLRTPLVLLVLSLFLPTASEATMPAANGRYIAFTAIREGDSAGSDVFLLDRIRGDRRNVTKGLRGHFLGGPWSPDSERMLVTSSRDSIPGASAAVVDADIYVFTPGTGELEPLTATRQEMEIEPVWSPDGGRVAFTTHRTVGANGAVDTSIEVMNIDGTGRREIAEGFEPSWSPDGTKIAYTAWPREPDESTAEIATISLDGEDPQVLTEGGFAGEADWSPDGTKIVYVGLVSDRRFNKLQPDVLVMNVDGSGVRRLTATRRAEAGPHWSPDGRFILFSRDVRDRDPDVETREIFRMRVSTGTVRRLTEIRRIAVSAYWQPQPM